MLGLGFRLGGAVTARTARLRLTLPGGLGRGARAAWQGLRRPHAEAQANFRAKASNSGRLNLQGTRDMFALGIDIRGHKTCGTVR